VGDAPHRLSVDAAVAATLSEARRGVDKPKAPTTDQSSLPSDVRSVVETVTGALRSTPSLRAADATVGTALIALGARGRHPRASAVVVGVHAIELALGRPVSGKWRAFDVQPDVSGDRIAITIRRTIGPR
jgi:hypothetical protein